MLGDHEISQIFRTPDLEKGWRQQEKLRSAASITEQTKHLKLPFTFHGLTFNEANEVAINRQAGVRLTGYCCSWCRDPGHSSCNQHVVEFVPPTMVDRLKFFLRIPSVSK